ncbi:hypothetical protein SCUCBS95973_000448 [Sporothrix curviconia]|uniref:EamA domain-containing protein n=1 Tax=Sporothrix curviconia TaxID=1260050 RepID=A0ABP0AQE6_9PEZI
MAPYLQIPQTPSAKTQFDHHTDELASTFDRSVSQTILNRPPSPYDQTADAEEIARYRRKTVSPAPSHPHPLSRNDNGLGNHLGLPDDAFHRLSIGSMSDAGYGPATGSRLLRPYSPSAPGTLEPPASVPLWARIWARNKAVLLVFGAQFFGALMNLFARLLELEGEHGLHPIQLLFIRMVVTTLASCLYMHHYRVPHFPLGPPGVRGLLALRGLTGFFGIFGMWYSMMYLPLAEATVFTFLVPSVSGYICYITLKEPFTRKEQIASVVALLGIVLITRPLSLFSSSSSSPETDAGNDSDALNATMVAIRDTLNSTLGILELAPADSGHVPSLQRFLAIAVALLGVLGGSCAFTTIRAIGTRAHPLISVNYFSTWCVIVSGTVLTFAPMLHFGQPALRFALPHSFRQWILLLIICTCGFVTQFLATKGLGLERSNRAAAMVYTQMLFAAGFDRFVFGHEMGPTSLVGCGLIIGSALWVALSKKPSIDKGSGPTEMAALSTATTTTGADIEICIVDARGIQEEAAPMLGAEEESDIDDLIEPSN